MSTGPSFWDQGILTVIGLDRVKWISDIVPNVGLNVTFMIFGAVGLAFNIFTRWVHTSLFFSHFLSIGHVHCANIHLLNFNHAQTAVQTFTRVGDKADRIRSRRCYTCFHSRRRCFCRSFGYRTPVWKIPQSSIPSRWYRSCAPGV